MGDLDNWGKKRKIKRERERKRQETFTCRKILPFERRDSGSHTHVDSIMLGNCQLIAPFYCFTMSIRTALTNCKFIYNCF